MNSSKFRGSESRRIGFSCIKGSWILLAVGFLLGMAYLWLYSQVVETSTTVETYESRFDYLSNRNVVLRSRLAKLQTPAVITRRLKERKIILVDPYPEQIVRIRQDEGTSAKEIVRSRPPQDLVILSIAR